MFYSAITGVFLWSVGLVLFVELFPRVVTDEENLVPTDALVVLTGGRHRIKEGLRLHRSGIGKRLFISGMNPLTRPNRFFKRYKVEPALQNTIDFGYHATSTIENAQETLGWMRAQGFRSLRLVTSSYHLKRSLLEFNQRLQDMEIIPHPVFPKVLEQKNWWQNPKTLLLVMREYNKYIAAFGRCMARAFVLKIQSV